MFLKVQKHVVENERTSMKKVPPESFYSLIVTALACYKTSSIRTS